MKNWKVLTICAIVILTCVGCGTQETAAPASTESSDVSVFAEKIQNAVADKDLEALADLCSYPLAVNSEEVDNKEAFLALGEDVIFTEERCAVVAAVDVSTLEETMAGFIMGDATPNIIFKSVDGNLGITGIN